MLHKALLENPTFLHKAAQSSSRENALCGPCSALGLHKPAAQACRTMACKSMLTFAFQIPPITIIIIPIIMLIRHHVNLYCSPQLGASLQSWLHKPAQGHTQHGTRPCTTWRREGKARKQIKTKAKDTLEAVASPAALATCRPWQPWQLCQPWQPC